MRVTPYAIPFRQPLWVGGAEVPARCGWLLEGDDGGLGEAVVLPLGAAPDWGTAALARDGAALDGAARAAGVRLAEWLGGVQRTRIPLNALLAARDPEACAAAAAAAVAAGFRCLKLKLDARDLDGEVRRLAAVRAAVGDAIALRADANAAWSLDEAISALRALAPFALEYVEQPVAGIAALAALRRAVPVPLAADEAVVDVAAVERIIAAAAADVIVLKPALLGLRASLAAAARARAAGLGVVVTSALESSLGIAAAAHVAAAIAGPLLPCGLATAGLLAGDLAAAPLACAGGELLLPTGAGLGVELDRAALARWQVGRAWRPRRRPTRAGRASVAAGARPWIDQRAETHAARPALRSGDEALTFAALRARAARASGRLAAAGIGRGDRVALLIADRLAFAVWVHGVTRLGAVAVPIGDRLPPVEVARQLRAVRCRALVADGARRALARALATPGAAPPLDADELDAAPHAAVPLDLAAPHSIVFTSGSSGAPTPVVLTAGNHYWSAVGSALALGVHDDDRWLACLPPHHVGGLAILLRGAISAIPVVLHAGFDAEAVNRALDADRITLLSLVPAMLQRLLDARGARPFPASLRRVLLGGAPAPRALCDAARRRGVPLAPTYGMTEAASQLVTDGRPLLGVRLRIAAPASAAPAARAGDGASTGRIEVRGPMLAPGTLSGDGTLVPHGDWLRTNDLGRFDADGRLHVLGRADDVIISGGENVHPREVEDALESHPAVAEACVFGLPDPTWGEIVAAQVRLAGRADAAAIAAHAGRLLAPGKRPRRLEIVADFPRSAAGKILRHAARATAQMGT